jgi:hypothetical protein
MVNNFNEKSLSQSFVEKKKSGNLKKKSQIKKTMSLNSNYCVLLNTEEPKKVSLSSSQSS